MSLLKNDTLGLLLDKYNISFCVYLHKYHQPYIHTLSSPFDNVRILQLGESSPSELISTGNMLITDYSSVSWDFFYLSKPVLFYRFDISEYLLSRGCYISLDEENLGEITQCEDDLVNKIEEYCENGFLFKPCFQQYRESILPAFDGKNCSRIYNEVLNIERGE